MAYEVKCARCDRRYSALRTRCPYCGARRRTKGKRVSDGNDSVMKLVIGAALVVVLIVAVIVLLVNAGKDSGASSGSSSTGSTSSGQTSGSTSSNDPDDGNGVTDITDPDDGSDPDDGNDPDDGGDEPAIPDITVQSIKLINPWGTGEVAKDSSGTYTYDVSFGRGESYTYTYETVPVATDKTVTWSSSDENVVVVTQEGKITAIGTVGQSAVVTVSVDRISVTMIVRIY